MVLKGQYVVLEKFKLRIVLFTILMGQRYKLESICFFHNWINKLLSEERWQSPPHINKVKQYENVFLNFLRDQ